MVKTKRKWTQAAEAVALRVQTQRWKSCLPGAPAVSSKGQQRQHQSLGEPAATVTCWFSRDRPAINSMYLAQQVG